MNKRVYEQRQRVRFPLPQSSPIEVSSIFLKEIFTSTCVAWLSQDAWCIRDQALTLSFKAKVATFGEVSNFSLYEVKLKVCEVFLLSIKSCFFDEGAIKAKKVVGFGDENKLGCVLKLFSTLEKLILKFGGTFLDHLATFLKTVNYC